MHNLDPALEFCSEFMEIVKPNCSVEGEIKFTCGGLKNWYWRWFYWQIKSNCLTHVFLFRSYLMNIFYLNTLHENGLQILFQQKNKVSPTAIKMSITTKRWKNRFIWVWSETHDPLIISARFTFILHIHFCTPFCFLVASLQLILRRI